MSGVGASCAISSTGRTPTAGWPGFDLPPRPRRYADGVGITDIAADEFVVPFDFLEAAKSSAGIVVEDSNLMTLGDQPFHERASEKSRAARDEVLFLHQAIPSVSTQRDS